jgi:predicted DNA-binding transcriptional regulator YafY
MFARKNFTARGDPGTMASMGPSLRYVILLALVPAAPRRLTTTTLLQLLIDHGFEVDRRTVQRDLKNLAEKFPIVSYEEENNALSWSWTPGAKPPALGGVDPLLAMVLVIIDQYFAGAFPKSVRQALEPITRVARVVLEDRDRRGPGAFLRRFRFVPKGPPVLPPEVDEAVLDAVPRAVGDRRRIVARYRPGNGPAGDYHLEPLGLVMRGPVMILVARKLGEEKVKTFLVHRFREVEVRDEPVNDDGFDLDAYIASGQLGFVTGPPIELVARFRGSAVRTVEETRLSRDQRIEYLPGDQARVFATVYQTRELQGWLMGFGPGVVVEGPPPLARAIALAHAEAAALYLAGVPA